MEKIEYSALSIVQLYLEKLEQLTLDERKVLIRSIDLINNPVFITDAKL